jgi:hypothetical protein
MKMKSNQAIVAIALCCWLSAAAFGGGVPAEIKSKLDAQVTELKSLSTDPRVVKAVKANNAAPPSEYKGMTNEKWKELTVLDPLVRALTKNALAEYLKTKKNDVITEAFVSATNGTKVAFLSKTTSWTHKGKPKHDVPMTGKVWVGPVEVDESTGQQQIQVGFPVLDGGKPIGSIVVGLKVAALR